MLPSNPFSHTSACHCLLRLSVLLWHSLLFLPQMSSTPAPLSNNQSDLTKKQIQSCHSTWVVPSISECNPDCTVVNKVFYDLSMHICLTFPAGTLCKYLECDIKWKYPQVSLQRITMTQNSRGALLLPPTVAFGFSICKNLNVTSAGLSLPSCLCHLQLSAAEWDFQTWRTVNTRHWASPNTASSSLRLRICMGGAIMYFILNE